MFLIGGVVDLAATFGGGEKIGFFELVKLFSNGVGGNPELRGQFPQVGVGFRVKKESYQEFDPSFGADDASEDVVHFLVAFYK